MEQLLKLVNVELTAKLAISALLASAVIATGASALETGIEAQDQVHLEHQLWLEENSSPVDNGLDASEYEYSQKAKEIANANEKLAKLKASVNGGAK